MDHQMELGYLVLEVPEPDMYVDILLEWIAELGE